MKNSGSVRGAEVAEVYAALPADAAEPPKRLVGWSKMHYMREKARKCTLSDRSKYISDIYEEASENWKLIPGNYSFMAGGSSQDLPLVEKILLP